MRRTNGAAILFFVCLLMLALMPIAAQQSDGTQSRSARFHRKGARAIPNHYIVVLDRDTTGRAGDLAVNAGEIAQLMPEWAGTVTRRFNHAINGFAAYMTEQQLQANPGAKPAQARNELVNQANLNHLRGIPTGTANQLLF